MSLSSSGVAQVRVDQTGTEPDIWNTQFQMRVVGDQRGARSQFAGHCKAIAAGQVITVILGLYAKGRDLACAGRVHPRKGFVATGMRCQ